MSKASRRIPSIPRRPRVHPVAERLYRSYPVGRQSVSRVCQGQVLSLTITLEQAVSDHVCINLVSDLGSATGGVFRKSTFERVDERTYVCRVTPKYAGLRTFRAEFSLDGGATWSRDTLPDAWVLVDPPQIDGLRLYTMIPTASGTIVDWTADLSRIAEMGFNAVHLLPITELDTSESPYAAHDLFEIDNNYLAQDSEQSGQSQFQVFIQEAKRLGIRLCFDLVLNHIGVNSSMATKAPDWIAPDPQEPDGLRRARYWDGGQWKTWDDLVLINYEHPSEEIRSEIRRYMTDYALFWTKCAHDTGGFVRFDNLHSSDLSFVESLAAALHRAYPGVGIIAEYFTDAGSLLNNGPKWALNLILATPWDYPFVPQLREYLTYLHRDSEHLRYFMPITSHDSGTPAQEFGDPESTVPRYVAAALMGTGATGICQGVEYAQPERINFVGRQPKASYPDEPRFARFIGEINAILAEHAAFRQGGNCIFIDNDHPAIIAAFRKDTESSAIGYLVICNFDTCDPQSIRINLLEHVGDHQSLSCVELISGETQVVPSTDFELTLPPCGAHVFQFIART